MISTTLFISLGIGLVYSLNSALFFVFFKYVMDHKHIRPLMILLLNGLFGLFISLIVYFTLFIFDFNSSMKESILNVFSALIDIFNDWSNFGYSFGLLVMLTLVNLCTYSIVYYYNPISLANSITLIYLFQFI